MDRCEDCGGEWDLYGPANHIHPACFKHWCPRTGRERFKSASTPEEHARGAAAVTQSRANAARYRNDED